MKGSSKDRNLKKLTKPVYSDASTRVDERSDVEFRRAQFAKFQKKKSV